VLVGVVFVSCNGWCRKNGRRI